MIAPRLAARLDRMEWAWNRWTTELEWKFTQLSSGATVPQQAGRALLDTVASIVVTAAITTAILAGVLVLAYLATGPFLGSN